MSLIKKKHPVVLHSAWTWLPMTMNWLYSQVTGVVHTEMCVISRDVTNLDVFPVDHHAYVKSKVLRLLNIIFYHLGARFIPMEYLKLLRDKKVDILHSHFGDRGWYDMRLARWLNAHHLVSFYGLDVEYIPKRRKVWRKRYIDLFDSAEQVLVLGPVMRDNLINLGCPEEKIKIHHVGVNLENIRFRQRQYDPNADVLHVLIAASFREKKGIPIAIEALSRIHKDTDLCITIIGDTDNSKRSNKEKTKILEAISKCELKDSVNLLGYQNYSRVVEESYKNHIFINSSFTAKDGDAEGTPVVLMDMMANGIPVISTYHSDIPEIIENGINGWLAKEGDVDDLEKTIRSCIDKFEDWGEVTRSARSKIEIDFNNSIQSKKLNRIYEKYS